jgi:hypothetical protein
MSANPTLRGRLAALAIVCCAATSVPAQAQMFGSDENQMAAQFAPMLEMMKAKMGKRCYGQLMQTFGPMMANMMEGNGGMFGGGFGGFSGGGFGGGYGNFGADGYNGYGGYGGGFGNWGQMFGSGQGMGNIMAMLGGNGMNMAGLFTNCRIGRKAHHKRARLTQVR